MRKMLLKICCIVWTLFFLLAAAGAIDVSAQSACVFDPLTESVVFEKAPDQALPMASITKIMTALVAIEHYALADNVRVKKEYTAVEGSSMYLKEGQQISVSDLLYGLLLWSGNDASEALAGHFKGGRAAFICEMNQTAARLGLENTSFENPSGLDGPDHFTTASDFARLAAYAMDQPEFFKIVSSKYHKTQYGASMRNHNKLLWSCEGAVGVKTGYTRLSGRTLVSCVERKGRRLIAVTLNAPNDWNDHQAMYNEIFSGFTETVDVEKDETVVFVPVISGKSGFSRIVAAEDASFCLSPEELSMTESHVEGRHFVYAPVSKGQSYGTLVYTIGGRRVAQVPLVHEGDILMLSGL